MGKAYRNSRKVVVVGAGAVGSTFVYALAQSGLAGDIALMDKNERQAEGQVLDLAHGLPFFPPVNIHMGELRDYRDARVVVITAGVKQQPGESRLELLQRNKAVMTGIVRDIVAEDSEAVIVVVSNPVDILTYVALKEAGWPKNRIIGSGTVLDTSRFRYLLSRHCEVDARNVHAYILGEHGDSEIAAWSSTHIAGMPIDKYCPVCRKCSDWKKDREQIVQTVRDSAYHIIDYKGATCFAVGLALVRIVGAILRNERSVLTVSSLLDGEYGLKDVCLSLPCIVSENGVERILESELTDEELAGLRTSAQVLQTTLADLDDGTSE